MSVNIGDDGRRFVQVEIEVPGTPEEVWKTIATGPGISSWFVPTTVEEHVGGAFTADFGMGMESTSAITEWDPPRTFSKDGDGMDPDGPPVGTQWIVEAKSGGKCVVRVVHSWFASTDDWDGQWESVEKGWSTFFTILLLRLQHFAGQPSASFDFAGTCNGSVGDAWQSLTGPLGLGDGPEVRSGSGAPLLVGRVESERKEDDMETIVMASEPGPGVCHFAAMPMGEQVYVAVRLFVYGDDAGAIVERVKPQWGHWFGETFPAEG